MRLAFQCNIVARCMYYTLVSSLFNLFIIILSNPTSVHVYLQFSLCTLTSYIVKIVHRLRIGAERSQMKIFKRGASSRCYEYFTQYTCTSPWHGTLANDEKQAELFLYFSIHRAKLTPLSHFEQKPHPKRKPSHDFAY